jgi:pimeloyl-ACP methyl ester carboxylesterase
MKELACQFGPDRQLAGILTEPRTPAPRPIVVLVSAGVTPKCGPFRLHTELARRLARDGFRTLRVDLGGIGDSGVAYPNLRLLERTQRDLRAALDFLSEHCGLNTGTVMAGLCSGAEDSLRFAERDARVTRVVMVDAFAHRTAGFWWRHGLFRARRRMLRALGLHPALRSKPPSLVDYEHMRPAESRRLVRQLAARRVAMHFFYTAGMRERFNHAGQLRAMFPGLNPGRLVTVDYLPQVDHTQPFESDRRLLVERIAQRLSERIE